MTSTQGHAGILVPLIFAYKSYGPRQSVLTWAPARHVSLNKKNAYWICIVYYTVKTIRSRLVSKMAIGFVFFIFTCSFPDLFPVLANFNQIQDPFQAREQLFQIPELFPISRLRGNPVQAVTNQIQGPYTHTTSATISDKSGLGALCSHDIIYNQ